MTRIITFLKHNAIGLAALFVALGGTSYAAVAIPKNSVGSNQLRKGAVTSSKIHSEAITPGKLSSDGFGGRILYLAEISPIGKIVMSDPRGASTANWDSQAGTYATGGFVSWHRAIPRGCFPLTSASQALQTGSATPPWASGQVETVSKMPGVAVHTSDATSVTVAVVCGR